MSEVPSLPYGDPNSTHRKYPVSFIPESCVFLATSLSYEKKSKKDGKRQEGSKGAVSFCDVLSDHHQDTSAFPVQRVRTGEWDFLAHTIRTAMD